MSEGVYVLAKAYVLTDEKVRSASKFLGEFPRRIYKAVPEKFWINKDSEIDGNYVDVRTDIDLLA